MTPLEPINETNTKYTGFDLPDLGNEFQLHYGPHGRYVQGLWLNILIIGRLPFACLKEVIKYIPNIV